ncbi:MAG: septum site-determining protein MinC [Anaerolineales bacterium]|nr:septum site-determining protein MinC [Anaerolineales bacterium]
MMKPSLQIKGVHDALIITVDDGEWSEVRPALIESIRAQQDFFHGARIAFQLGDRALGAAEIGGLRDALARMDISFAAIISTHPATQEAAADLGIQIGLEHRPAEDRLETQSADTEICGDDAVFIQRTLRSGNNVRFPGHVIILGDVNPGAEIVAGGNIIIWGRLRGVVHAGAAGDEGACICALEMAPTQLRLAGHVAVSPPRPRKPKPEIALIRSGELIAEEWRRSGS